MAVSAHDVARELRQRLPSAGTVKLHKLLYYCQGWHLAWTGESMFKEEIQAWANGPVVADVWRDEKYGQSAPEPARLDSSMLATLGYVVSRYGRMNGRQLIVQTHDETPWRQVSLSDSENDMWVTSNPEITHAALRDYFANEEEEEVALRDLAKRALADKDIYADVVESIKRAKTQPEAFDDLSEIANLVAGTSPS